MKTSERLEIGSAYSRKQLQSLFGIKDATLNTGIFQPKGHESVWLFVTEEKTADRTQYEDRLDGDDLYFEGQTQGRTDDLIKEHSGRGLELLLFHRMSKSELPGYAFRYEGPFKYVSSEGAKPTKFHLRREGAGLPTPIKRLVTVKHASEIQDNVRRFAMTASINGRLAIKFARHTRYWVYDLDDEVFCPNTFAGYRDMTFELYSRFKPQIYKQIGYDGKIAREAIEELLPDFAPDDQLFERLRKWLDNVVEPGALSEASSMVREFTTIGSRTYRAIACNPKRYDGLSACRALDEITWTADPGAIDVGARVIIWQTLNQQGQRGVVGIGECVAAPTSLPEPEVELPFWKEEPSGATNRCVLRLLDAPGLPLWIDEHDELLSELPVARAHGGTFFSLDRSKWQAIRRAAGASLGAEGAKIEIAGQGRQLDPRVRKVVEMRAMEMAETHFLGEGWLVDPDVHKTKPYDLLCTKAGQTLYVEAKGTVGAGQSVILTRNEVAHVRANPGACVLFVVSGIEIEWSDGKPQASGGKPQIFHEWEIDEQSLSATQYDYRVPDAS